MLYRVSCHFVFPLPSPAEAGRFPWVSAGCTEAAFCIVPLLCGDGPSAETQPQALPSPTPPAHLCDTYLFRCLQGGFFFFLFCCLTRDYEAVLRLLMDK